jgi:sugar lactone lactonase YvrE
MLSGGTGVIEGVQGGGGAQQTKRAKRSFSTTRKVGAGAGAGAPAPNLAKRDLEGGVAACATGPVASPTSGAVVVAATTYTTPVVSTYAGSGAPGHLPSIYRPASLYPVKTTSLQQYTVPSTNVRFNSPRNLCFDPNGNLYVADTDNKVIKVISNGSASLFAGADVNGQTNGTFSAPRGIVVDFQGRNLYVADGSSIKKIVIATRNVTLYCGSATSAESTDGAATTARFSGASYLDIDSTGNLYIVDTKNGNVRIVSSTGTVSTPTWNTSLPCPPVCIRCDSTGNLYVSTMNGSIYKVTSASTATLYSGTESLGFADGSSSTSKYNMISGMILDSSNKLYVADTGNNRIRMVGTTGASTTILGNGSVGMKNSDASTTPLQTSLSAPTDVAMDRSGNLYIIDSGNHAVRMVAIAPPKAEQLLNEITNLHQTIDTDVQLLTDPTASAASIQQGVSNIINGFLRIHALNMQAIALYPTIYTTMASSVASLQPNLTALPSGPVQRGGADLLYFDNSLLSGDALKKKSLTSPLPNGAAPPDVIGTQINKEMAIDKAETAIELQTAATTNIKKFGFYDTWKAADPKKLHGQNATTMVSLLNNTYAIRDPSKHPAVGMGIKENWKRLLFTPAEANFLNDSRVTPGILQEVFAESYDLTINVSNLNTVNPVIQSLITIDPTGQVKLPLANPTDTKPKLYLLIEDLITSYYDSQDPLEPNVQANILQETLTTERVPPTTGRPISITVQMKFPKSFIQDDVEGLQHFLENQLKMKPITVTETINMQSLQWPLRLANVLTLVAAGTCDIDYKIGWLNSCTEVKNFMKKIMIFYKSNDKRVRYDRLLTVQRMKMMQRQGVAVAGVSDPWDRENNYNGKAMFEKPIDVDIPPSGGLDDINFSVRFNYIKGIYFRKIALRDSTNTDTRWLVSRLTIPSAGMNYDTATNLLKKEYAVLLSFNKAWDFFPST